MFFFSSSSFIPFLFFVSTEYSCSDIEHVATSLKASSFLFISFCFSVNLIGWCFLFSVYARWNYCILINTLCVRKNVASGLLHVMRFFLVTNDSRSGLSANLSYRNRIVRFHLNIFGNQFWFKHFQWIRLKLRVSHLW